MNFTYLEGLASQVDRELRDTEDALVAFIAAEDKRRSLYEGVNSRLTDKYPALQAGR